VRRPPQVGPECGSEVPRKEGTTAVPLDAATTAVAGRHISQSLLTGPAGNGGLAGGPRVVSETGGVKRNGIPMNSQFASIIFGVELMMQGVISKCVMPGARV
jgi:hypothetical protein